MCGYTCMDLASVFQAGKSVGVHSFSDSFLPIKYILSVLTDCTPTLFLPVLLRKLGVNYKILWGYTKVNARILLEGMSVGVHSSLPVSYYWEDR